MFIPTIRFLKAVLNSLVTLPGDPLTEATLALYAVGSTPAQGMLDDSGMVEPGYTGYVRQAITMVGAAFVNGAGQPTIKGPATTWRPTDALGTPALVEGLFILAGDGTTGEVLGWEEFETAKNMATVDDVIDIEPRLSLDLDGSYGENDVVI